MASEAHASSAATSDPTQPTVIGHERFLPRRIESRSAVEGAQGGSFLITTIALSSESCHASFTKIVHALSHALVTKLLAHASLKRAAFSR
jgi:hypothetical protein